jgi:Sigma-70, region 4
VRVQRLKPGPQNVRFQNHAFDASLGSAEKKKEFSKTIADFGSNSIKGFQITQAGVGVEKKVPAWAYLKPQIQKILLTAFPKLQTDSAQRKRAGRWAQVINMYYLQGMTAEEVAEELNETRVAIKRFIVSISRISKGLTAASGCQRKR